MLRALPLVLAFLLPAVAGAQVKKEIVPIPGASNPLLSPAVKVGDMLYLSGQLGFVPGGRLAEGGIGPETRQTLENIKRVLEAAGSSMEQVVKCTVYLADVTEFRAMNEVYRTFWPADPPARTTVAVAGLVANARIEIECLALAGKAN